MADSKQDVVKCILCRRHSWGALDPYILGCAFVKKTRTKKKMYTDSAYRIHIITLVRVLFTSYLNTVALIYLFLKLSRMKRFSLYYCLHDHYLLFNFCSRFLDAGCMCESYALEVLILNSSHPMVLS